MNCDKNITQFPKDIKIIKRRDCNITFEEKSFLILCGSIALSLRHKSQNHGV